MSTALNTLASDLVSALNQQNTATKGLSPIVGTIVSQPRVRDPNAPDYRLQINQRCIYERRLPGDAYITAHVQRLQYGFYDTPQTHEPRVDNVRFVSITFVFHPSRKINRFTSASISIALHTDPEEQQFLKHAPHLLYGSVSPETLNWNFNVAGSLGVAEGPVSASAAPSGGLKGSYKLYDMMKLQGSVRSLRSWQGREYDLEDGEMVWTLEENSLQKSGLPREFTFVMLVTKGDAENVNFDIEIKPTIGAWFGHFPMWYTQLGPYRPIHTHDMDLDEEVGQVFEPGVGNDGFNFATLVRGLDDFVALPGMTYSNTDFVPSTNNSPTQTFQRNPQLSNKPPVPGGGQQPPSSDINLRVTFEGTRSGTPSRSPAAENHYVNIPLTYTPHTHGLRHSRSRSELSKEARRNSLTQTPPLSQRNPHSQPSTQSGEPKLRVLSEVQGSPSGSRTSYTARQNENSRDNVRFQTTPPHRNNKDSPASPREGNPTSSNNVNSIPARTQSIRRSNGAPGLQIDVHGSKPLFGALPVRRPSTRQPNSVQTGTERKDHVRFQASPPSAGERGYRQSESTRSGEPVQNGQINLEEGTGTRVNRRPSVKATQNGDMQDQDVPPEAPFAPTAPTATNSRRSYIPPFQNVELSNPSKRLSSEGPLSDLPNRYPSNAPPEYTHLYEDQDILSELQRPRRFSPRDRPFSSYIPPADDDKQLHLRSGAGSGEKRLSYQEYSPANRI